MVVKPNVTEEDRRKLYHEYMRAICVLLHEEYDEGETNEQFQTYMTKWYIEWIDIMAGTVLAGFMVVGKPPECHPNADYFIIQFFVRPEFRRKRIASVTVEDYIKRNKGVYVLDIIDENEAARRFWAKTFLLNGYEAIVLNPVPHGTGANVHMYAWQPRKTEMHIEPKYVKELFDNGKA